MQRKLREAIEDNQGVRELAENPLLLTLLAVMQQNSIELPRRRVELYDVVTRTLLENRNIARGLPAIPEAQAIQRLGPLALQMQETRNSFARTSDVLASLKQTIKEGTDEEKEREAQEFLRRVRERGGLFVLRTGDYFGFFHRTFQEYFAARQVLNAIKRDPVNEITTLVNKARQSDDLWREPFLLAVAYQSGEDETVARRIMEALLTTPQGADAASQAHDLLLAAECLLEAKPLTIGSALEQRIARSLLQTYEQAQQERQFETCEEIENLIQRWLLGLSKEAYRPAVVIVLNEAISDMQNTSRQRSTLTLLTMIAQQLTTCPPIVFDTLIPPLLALAGLPAVGAYEPAATLTASSNLDVVDLALAALSFMDRRGPAGLFLAEVRQHFETHPQHLRLLARYSLESGTLLTLAVVPLAEDNYQRYESAIGRWIQLRDKHRTGAVTEREIAECLSIHQELLACAEAVSYPAATHFLNMLHVTAEHPDQPWQQLWRQYLAGRMAAAKYIDYQEAALLWMTLFPGQQELQTLASSLAADYKQNGNPVQRYAQRILVIVVNDPRYLRGLRGMRGLRGLRGLRYLRDLRDLRYPLLTPETAKHALHLLPASDSADATQYIDLLTILLGRILQISEAKEMGSAIEGELQHLAQVACDRAIATGNNAVREVALDMLRYLPARSVNEVNMVLGLAERASDERIRGACADAIRSARPETPDPWAALEAGKGSRVQVVRDAVEECLKRK